MSAAKEVNGIPSAYHFKTKLGRNIGSFRFRTRDPAIDAICEKLTLAEAFRAVYNQNAIDRLRAVRRQCHQYEQQNVVRFKPYRDTPKVIALRDAVSAQINAVAEQIMGIHRARDEDVLNQRIFDTFYTDQPYMQAQATGVGRKLGHSYQLERANSMHLPSSTMKAWLKSGSRLGYRNWAATVEKWLNEDRKDYGSFLINNPNAEIQPQTVQYLTEQERADYQLTFRAGRAYDAENCVYHSGHHKSVFNGAGWSIYTVDFEGNFYVGGHKVNEFHHSSFFAGQPVMAAGEIAVNQGVVVGLTNKTGHYKAGPGELHKALQLLQSKGVNLNNVVVTDPFRCAGKWYSGSTALAAMGNLKDIIGNRIPTPLKPIVPLVVE